MQGSGGEFFGVGAAEHQTVTSTGEIGAQLAGGKPRQAVEKNALDADVVVEVLDLAERKGGTGGVGGSA
jgi:hypothetical protein